MALVTNRPPPEGWLELADDYAAEIGGISIRRSEMNREMVMDLIRFVMKVGGSWFLATKAAQNAGLDLASWQQLTAGALVLGSLLWSLVSTHQLTK